jgi:branched-chain amino acid transport system permease protein
VLKASGFLFSNYRLAILAAAMAAIAGSWLLLNKTAFGMVVRAGTADPEMVRALGIRLRPVLTVIFGLGVGIAGLAGVMSAPLAGVQPAMGTKSSPLPSSSS